MEGTKKVYDVREISMARPMTTPEFEKTYLWGLVKDNEEFLKFMPDGVKAKPRRLNKD